MNVRNIRLGASGGYAGGVVFGLMMAQMGMLPMIGQMVGHPSAAAGFLVHLVISASIGASFAVLFHSLIHSKTTGLSYGLTYGAAWWFLGPLTLMPLFMGMGLGVNWNAAAATQMLPSLVGHLVYGAVLGLTYTTLRGWAYEGLLPTSVQKRKRISNDLNSHGGEVSGSEANSTSV